MELRSYTLEQLKAFQFQVPGNQGEEVIPLNPLRLRSYLHNPRADPSDPVLFEMWHGGRIIAYRTLLPDCFFDPDGKLHRFAWLSGNYVIPSFRRKGISTQLLNSAEEGWKGRLMYTNYAPASKAVYDRTGRFQLIDRREGRRFYLRVSAESLLGERMGGKLLFRSGDRIVNRFAERRLKRFEENVEAGSGPEPSAGTIRSFDRELALQIDEWQKGSLFRRDAGTFTWILDDPWVADMNADPLPYHFTYRAARFENLLMRYGDPGEAVKGFLWMVIRNEQLTVPYAFARNGRVEQVMAEQVILAMISSGCSHTTIRNPSLLKQMEKQRRWFLLVRRMPQLIFAHRELAGQIPAGLVIHDGDGDMVFTG